MSEDRTRILSAVMFADMVGFTAIMGRDEDLAREQRDRQRDVVSRHVEEFGGQVKQYYGDGTLSVFGSAVEAARCAVAIQAELRRPPEVSLRIGIHTGDVVDEGDGVYGDGVNVASRVESLAPVGGVVVSDKVFDDIKNHSELGATSLGSVHLKNVARPIEIFVLTGEGLPVPGPDYLQSIRSPSRESRTGLARMKSSIGAVAALLLIVGIVWGSRQLAPDASVAPYRPEDRELPSIAVLPFRNLSSEAENAAFFAAGIHDDILTQLTKVGSIDVIARTSVMRYAASDAPVPVIGRELGVGMVLEGGVQRAGDRIRLNVQLIDVETDAHAWAETYDLELNAENVFSIQTQVAEAIARELSAVLTGDERRALAEVPTASLEAYDWYLIGLAAMRRNIGRRDLQVAEDAFEEAATIDPEFAAALGRLAHVHLDVYWNAFDRTPGRLESAREALERAEAIDPSNPEVLVARGYYHYWGFREYSAAQIAFASAQRALPGDARLSAARAYVLRRIGSWREAVDELESAVSLDPLNGELWRELGRTHLLLGEYDLAQSILDEAIAVEPSRWSSRYDRGLTQVLRDGDVEGLVAVLRMVSVQAPAVNPVLEYMRWWTAYVEGEDSLAFAITGGVSGPLEQQAAINPRALLNALMHQAKGRLPRAEASADSARVALEALLATRPEDPRVHAALGTALAILGRRDEAIRAGDDAVGLLPIDRDAMDGPEYVLHLARIRALLGDDDAAAELVAQVLSVPTGHSRVSVLLEPAFAALRDHPLLRGP